MARTKGYRTIEGKAFLLNGTCSAYMPADFSPEGMKAKLKVEKAAKESQGLLVRFIKRTSFEYAVYTFPRD